MTGEAAEAPKPMNKWTRRIAVLLVGLFVSLLAGKLIESISDREWLEEAEAAQKEWIIAVGETSPVGIAAIFWDEISAILGDGQSEEGWRPTSAGVASPMVALWHTVERIIDSGGIITMIQLGLGALALAVINFLNSSGKSILFNEGYANLLGIPLGVIFFASLIGGALWLVLMGALYLLSWVTSLAVWAAGATGIVGFCWLCVTKLAEKGVEHVATPKI
jgi:hypothetical protein